jgi:hypothetical protein
VNKLLFLFIRYRRYGSVLIPKMTRKNVFDLFLSSNYLGPDSYLGTVVGVIPYLDKYLPKFERGSRVVPPFLLPDCVGCHSGG